MASEAEDIAGTRRKGAIGSVLATSVVVVPDVATADVALPTMGPHVLELFGRLRNPDLRPLEAVTRRGERLRPPTSSTRRRQP